MLSALVLASELVVLVDTATEMPMARFEQGRLVEGVHKDVGEALARRLGRDVRFMPLPRKRIELALDSGAADVLCSYVPEWVGGSFAWTQPFLPISEVLVTDARSPRPRALEDVAGQPVGTVLGYVHPEIEEVLGKRFVRADGPTAETNLRKLAAGRVRHALTSKSLLDYRMKLGDPKLSIHPPLLVKTYQGQCAVSPRGRVALADVDRAVGALLKDGSVAAILDKYR
jgi:ABC-type amino acid transport substrate-binding protein